MPPKKKPAAKKTSAKKPAAKKSATKKSAGGVYQLKVTLRDSHPPIWRRLLVPASCTFGDLHVVLQIAMGWQESHLHQFVAADGTYYSNPDFELEDVCDEDGVRLADVAGEIKSRLLYEYDFGDGWEHEILVEKIFDPEPGATYPSCTAGKGAGPPEDVGGVWGYEIMLEAIADENHERHEEFMEWVDPDYDPAAFDLDAVNRKLAKLR